MKRKCKCAGSCTPQTDAVSRRDFIAVLGSSAVLAGTHAGAAPATSADWHRDLFRPTRKRVYQSGVHKDARLHLGGVGTGNFEIGSDGRLTTWQLFNTLRDGTVPMMFGVNAGGVSRALQTEADKGITPIASIQMVGEYPFADLSFIDPALPVEITLSSFSPFAPLDSRTSAIPAAIFTFRVKNGGRKRQKVSIAGFLQNPVGYEADGDPEGNRHPQFGGNLNEPMQAGSARGVHFRALAGKPVRPARTVRVHTNLDAGAMEVPFNDRSREFILTGLDRMTPPTADRAAIIWLEDAAGETTASALRKVRETVEAGATAVICGSSQPLLGAYAAFTGGKPYESARARADVVFEDFESGYANWTVTGDAFGAAPAQGTLANQNPVTGFAGHGLVNSYLNGDDTTGKMVSKTFTVERSFIRFLVGGGNFPTTQVRLIVAGKVVRAASGRNEEQLRSTEWDVREFAGKQAHIEIVDEAKGGWGHINVDHIVFADAPGDPAALEALDALLPASIATVKPGAVGDAPVIDGVTLRPGAEEQEVPGLGRVIRMPIGKGTVMLLVAALLPPVWTQQVNARQRAYAGLLTTVGIPFESAPGCLEVAPGYGDMALVSTGAAVTCSRPADTIGSLWSAFAADGTFSKQASTATCPTPPGATVSSAVASTVDLKPGQSAEISFVLAWRYPNKYNPAGVWMGTHYATLWPSAADVAGEVVRDLADLRARAESFRRCMYDTTLPYWLVDCLTSQAAIARHIGIVFRTANGDTFGWEGSNGCCQPTCTHVWGYEQSLSRLFPDLERHMRRIDFKHQQRPDGGVNNRTDIPSPLRPTGEQPFMDGHASCILKAYREAMTCSDPGWMKEYWPHIKSATEFLIGRDARAHGEPAGLQPGDQWNTYDEALHGVTSFISGYYLAALRAAEAWGTRVGDTDAAARFKAIREKGAAALVARCWNGEYFQQDLPEYMKMSGEVGPGCMSDQLIGQWWCHQLGLGYILPADKVKAALRAIYKYNFKDDLTGWKHSPRAFAGDKDRGLIIVTWPKGGRPPSVMLYSDEVWTGIEYQVAGHMMYEGMVPEAFAIVKGARDRYDGIPRAPIPRNPWNEIECGGHYARAMSSWSLLLAASGWHYDAPSLKLRVTPCLTPSSFRSFFCGSDGWGTLQQKRSGSAGANEIAVVEGRLEFDELTLQAPKGRITATARIGGQEQTGLKVSTSDGLVRLTFASPITLSAGDLLKVEISAS